MTLIRRLALAGAILVLLGAPGLAPPAHAQPGWDQSWEPDPPPSRFTGGEQLAGRFRHPAGLAITEIVLELDDGGCEAPPMTDNNPALDGEVLPSTLFSFTVAPPCNGTYSATVTATASADGVPVDESSLSTDSVAVEIPPPPVTGVTAVVNADKTVTVTWSDPGRPQDSKGYQIERSVNDGGFSAVGNSSEATTFADSAVPADAATLRYRVVSLRQGATADSTVTAAADSDSVAFAAPTSTTAATPSRSGSGGGGGGPSRASGPRTPTTTPLPDTGESTFNPDDVEPGEEDAVLPDDEFARGTVLQRFDDDPVIGRGVLLPFAGGLVLFVWAMHLRFITHQAATATTGEHLVVTPGGGDYAGDSSFDANPRRRSQPLRATPLRHDGP